MPPIVIPSTIKVECEGTYLGQPWVNVFHTAAIDPDPLDSTDAATIRNAFYAFYGSVKVQCTPDWNLSTITVTDIRTSSAPQYSFSSSQVGTASGESMAPDLAIVITWYCTPRGRSYRGRTYLCGFGETVNTTGGRIVPATQSALVTAADTLRTTLLPTGYPLAVASRTLLVATPVSTVRVNNVWDRQIRRRFAQ